MFQVVALYANCDECGYGESEDYAEAMRECAASVPDIYPSADVVLHSKGMVRGCPVEIRTALDVWRMFA